MSDLHEAVLEIEDQASDKPCPVATEAFAIYLAINKPDLRTAIANYASAHRISTPTAVAEACRAYFVGE